MNEFLEQALAHAKKRWCWDDAAFLQEVYDAHPPITEEPPAEWVDWLAEKYDLTDPKDGWL